MAGPHLATVLLLLVTAQCASTSPTLAQGKTGDSRVESNSGLRALVLFVKLLGSPRATVQHHDVAPSPVISTSKPPTATLTTPLPELQTATAEPLQTDWKSSYVLCPSITLILLALLVVSLVFWFKHSHRSRSTIIEPECNYSYVEVQKLPISELRTLVSTNKRLQEQSFIPSLPARPRQLIYDEPYV